MAKATKPKRGPGRPRSVPKPEGLDRTACAHHFDVNVKTVDRWLREGVPCTRYNGRVFFDVEAVAEWREDFESQQREPGQAQVLHPSDPRHIEKTAAAKVKTLRLALEVGAMLDGAALQDRLARDVADLNSRINAIPSMVGDLSALTRDNAEAILAGAVDFALADFTPDDPIHFPECPFVVEDEADPDEFEDHSWMPLLPASDPRAAIARANAHKHLAELKALQESCFPVEYAQRRTVEFAERIREGFRSMPAKIAARLAPGRNDFAYVRAVIGYESDVVKIALGGRYPPPPKGADKATKEFFASMEPVPPVSVDSDDGFEDDDCDGLAEFEDSESEAFEDA